MLSIRNKNIFEPYGDLVDFALLNLHTSFVINQDAFSQQENDQVDEQLLNSNEIESEDRFLSNEREMKKAYNKRVIDVEHGCFTPLVFTPYGGCGREADRCISELSHMIAKKRDICQSMVTNWLRTKISFALVKAAVLCLRGSRSIRKVNDINGENIEISDFVGKICLKKISLTMFTNSILY